MVQELCTSWEGQSGLMQKSPSVIRSFNMNYSGATFLAAVLLLSCSHLVLSDKWCDASELEQCAHSESCVVETLPLRNPVTQHLNGTCHCLKDYKRDSNGDCVRVAGLGPGYEPLEKHSASASSVAAGVLIPLTLIATIGVLVYFGRRYHWLEKLKQPAIRQYDTVLIGAQMEGDDDPPIS